VLVRKSGEGGSSSSLPPEACRSKTTVMKKVNVILGTILQHGKREVRDLEFEI
jgi:hypothetical protein